MVYGKSSYDGFPYRHPFITIHEVVHEQDGPRLAEGRLLTPRMLIDLVAGLGRALPLEILPERVMVRTEDVIVWWSPTQKRRMFFSDRTSDAKAKLLNGGIYPHPALVFKASKGHLWVRALGSNQRPTESTNLFIAPYWNCYDNAAVCTGSMRVPEEKSVTAIDLWEQSFFQSEFTHAGGVRRHTKYQRGLLAMWESLKDKEQFPSAYLVKTKQTLVEFARNHDHSYANQNHEE